LEKQLEEKERIIKVLQYFGSKIIKGNNIDSFTTIPGGVSGLIIDEKLIIDYLFNNEFSVFPYNYIKKYSPNAIKVYTKDAYKYVLHDNKKLFFPKEWSEDSVACYYNSLLIEQDIESPHRYDAEGFSVENGNIIADVGAAEGIWALSNVEMAKEIYLFECEDKWIKVLSRTFEPWKEKVHIINKYISNINENTNITIDDFFYGKEINIIKADIEGSEVPLLEGANNILSKQKDLKLLLCTYHNQNDAEVLEKILNQYQFVTEYSKGYMIFIYDKNISPPYLRRGIIRAKKI
jgi:hypothetical protein